MLLLIQEPRGGTARGLAPLEHDAGARAGHAARMLHRHGAYACYVIAYHGAILSSYLGDGGGPSLPGSKELYHCAHMARGEPRSVRGLCSDLLATVEHSSLEQGLSTA